ncbi:MAG: hypothetical protein JWQ09_3491 [Segetibacter sp.]|nr:hypothetical protein [Segetibacter sp.]
MKTVRHTATILFYLSRIMAVIVFVITVYALTVVLLSLNNHSTSLPIRVLDNGSFQIFYPFTKTPFLLGDYTLSYLLSNLLIIAFYGLFLWLLSDVFHAFKQTRLFTQKGVMQLSRFYITNLVVPLVFLILLAVFGEELLDIFRITLLHLVIGVFAFFMAAIFKQGLLLQEEQDLIF